MSDIKYLTIPHLTTHHLTRFFSKVNIDPAIVFKGVPCWNWTAQLDGNAGYGYFKWQNRNIRTHRIMYAWIVGPLPVGIAHGEIDHLCRNRLCCNPVHLEFVPRIVNRRRRLDDTCKRGHALVGDNLYLNPSRTERVCRLCAHNRVRKHFNRPLISSLSQIGTGV